MRTQASSHTHTVNGDNLTPTSVLTVSLARYLVGHDIADVIEQDWRSKATPQQQLAFDNQGFNLDPSDEEGTLQALKEKLRAKRWDGVIVGWCTRGNKKFTVLFEKVVSLVVNEVVRREKSGDGSLRLMFCDGPDDLVNATLRTFGSEYESSVAEGHD